MHASNEMSLDLPTPKAFPAFPFNPPYEIQVELMRHLYTSIEQRKVTVVESPTGTVCIQLSGLFFFTQLRMQGKTLSLLCASLTWLLDEKDRAKKGKLREMVGDDADGVFIFLVRTGQSHAELLLSRPKQRTG